jgi:methionyl-tRNA formyltransferase
VPIEADDDAGTLHDKLAALGAEMIVAALDDIVAGRARAVSQPEEGVTYAAKITKADTRLDWSRSAVELERAVRAFRPQPGASATLAAEPVKIWRAHVVKDRGAPGKILSAVDALTVACGEGALAVTELQRPGARRLSAADFLRGRPLAAGVRFE